MARAEEAVDGSFVVLFGDVYEDEDENGETTDREVDPEA